MLESFWEDNREAMINYIKEVHKGIMGNVTDVENRALTSAAVVIGNGDPEVKVYSNKLGYYYRLLSPGQHLVTVKCEGYQSQNRTIIISPDKPYASNNFYPFALSRV